MQVTEVRIYQTDEDLIRAYVTITFDNCFMIREIKVIKSTTGHFVSMPSRKQRDGTHWDIAYPANAETRNIIQRVILAKYEKSLPQVAHYQARTRRPTKWSVLSLLAVTALEALVVLEAATVECKKHGGSQRGAGFVRPYIRPEWLIPQFRHHALKDPTDNHVEREGQQQVAPADL